jgi:DNA-directed RNA polymerase specialized sigma24 family protein
VLCHRIKKHEMGMTCCTHGEMADAYKVSVANVKRRIPLATRTCRQEDNIKIDCRRFGYGGVY